MSHTQLYNIFIISLPSSTERQVSAKQQLDSLALDYKLCLFERTTTITAKEYQQKKRLQLYGYDMRPGEIGVFLSHRALWQKIIESNIPAIILEDDFLISHPDIGNLFTDLTNLNHNCGLIRLQTCFENTTMPLFSLDNTTKIVTYSASKQGGATAYFIRPHVAQELFDNTQQFYMPVDDFMDTECLHKQFIYGVYPPPITITNMESEIGVKSKPSMSLRVKLKREVYRLPILLCGTIFALYKKYKLTKQEHNHAH